MKRIKYTLGILSLILGGIVLTKGVNAALSYKDQVTLQFDWNSSLAMIVSSENLSIDSLTPGNSAVSNAINITVTTNGNNGYKLSAAAGSSTTASTDLRKDWSSSAPKFEMISDSASLSALTTDNTWGYSLNNGNYSGLPIYSGTAKTICDTATTNTAVTPACSASGTANTFKIAAKAGSSQPSGDYTNVITFTAVANAVTE